MHFFIRSTKFLLFIIMLLISACGSTRKVPVQAAGPSASQQDTLTVQVSAMDNQYFEAYNARNLNIMQELHAEDVEFYHDKGGLLTGKKAVIKSIERFFTKEERIRSELVPGSRQVFPLAGVGAVLTANRIFYSMRPGKAERPAETARVIAIWRALPNNKWEVCRIVSYDHQPIAP